MRSAHKFLDVIGYSLDGISVEKTGLNTSEKYVESLRAQYIIPTELTHVTSLVDSVVNIIAYTIAKAEPKQRAYYLSQLAASPLEFTPALLSTCLSFRAGLTTTVAKEFHKNGLKGLLIPNLATSCLPYIASKGKALSDNYNNHNIDSAFLLVVKEMKSTLGMGYPHGFGAYSDIFQPMLHTLPERVKDYIDIDVDVKTAMDYLEPTTAQIAKILRSVL